jgi:hypothetical protein
MLDHPEDQVDRLASIIADSGFDVPIVVDKNKVIIKGHGRQLAAKKLGLEKVSVIVRDDLTPNQVKAMRISDNAIAYKSSINQDNLKLELSYLKDEGFDLGLTGYNDDEIQLWIDSDFSVDVGGDNDDEREGHGRSQLPDPGDANIDNPSDMFAVIIHCETEEEQGELLSRFTEEGLKCQALIS